MPFSIIKADITKIKADAIVNPTDSWFSGGGGTDAAIHCAAGEELKKELKDQPELGVGEVFTTSAGDLPCKYIIHTVGPVYQDGISGEGILLKSCYDKALTEAERLGCSSVAFPLIASGTFGGHRNRPRVRLMRNTENPAERHLYSENKTLAR